MVNVLFGLREHILLKPAHSEQMGFFNQPQHVTRLNNCHFAVWELISGDGWLHSESEDFYLIVFHFQSPYTNPLCCWEERQHKYIIGLNWSQLEIWNFVLVLLIFFFFFFFDCVPELLRAVTFAHVHPSVCFWNVIVSI